MPRHHRRDEYGQPTDRSLLNGGYDEAPGLSPRLLYAVGFLAGVVAISLYFILS